jgi:hypothetical protein
MPAVQFSPTPAVRIPMGDRAPDGRLLPRGAPGKGELWLRRREEWRCRLEATGVPPSPAAQKGRHMWNILGETIINKGGRPLAIPRCCSSVRDSRCKQ